MITKKNIKFIKKLSGLLPVTHQGGEQFRQIKGSALVSRGIVWDKNGKSIDPDSTYEFKTEQPIQVNHFRRMKTLLKTGGVPAVKKYCDDVFDLCNKPNEIKYETLY